MPPPVFVPAPRCALSVCASSEPSAQNRGATRRRRPAARPTARPAARAVSTLALGESLVGTVAHVGGADSAWLDINVATGRGKPVRARLRLLTHSRLGARKVPALGATLPVRVSRLNVPAARVEVVPAWELPRAPASSPAQLRLEELQVGQQLRGIVVGVVAAGAVVDVDVSRAARRGIRAPCTALLRRAHFAPRWASAADLVVPDDAERVVAPGDVLDVYVREANVQSAALFVDARPVTAEQLLEERRMWRARMAKRYRRKGVESLVVGQRRTGTVMDVQKYGCFVDVGVKNDGLIHFSDMGERYARTWKTEVGRGARVVVEVVEISGQRLNLRLVGLEGDDLDADGEVENLAIARGARSVGLGENGDGGVAAEDKGNVMEEDKEVVDGEDLDGEDEEEEEEGWRGNTFKDKFTDDYFEDKYDY